MESEYSSLKVVDLKRELRNRGLKTTGSKEELIDRLITYKSKLLGTSTDMDSINENIIESDILDEEGVLDELDDAEEDEVLKKVPSEDISTLSNSTKNDTNTDVESSIKHDQSSSSELPESNKKSAKKKVVLVRKSSVPLLGENIEAEENPDKSDEVGNGTEIKNVLLSTNLTPEERLKLRAKRFGIQSDEDRKTIRANRFRSREMELGEPIELLKKRAQRFGAIVSPVLTNNEQQEKLLARKARFGTISLPDNYEKKKLRAERFKMTLSK